MAKVNTRGKRDKASVTGVACARRRRLWRINRVEYGAYMRVSVF